MNYLAFSLLISTFIWSLIYNQALLTIYLIVIGIYLLMNIYYTIRFPGSLRSKIRIATWNDSGDPTVWGRVEVDMTPIDAFLEKYNSEHPDNKLTYTVVFAKAFGKGLSAARHLSGKIAFGNFIPSDTVDLSILCDVGGSNLDNVLVEGCERYSLEQLNEQIKSKVKTLKLGKDKDFNKQIKTGDYTPSFLVGLILRVTSWICYDLGLAFPPLQLKKNNYGTGIITNVTSFDIQDFFGPHVPFLKTIAVAVMNTPQKKPVVVDGKVEIRKIMNLNIAYDHRFADGADCVKMLKAVEQVFNNPASYL